MFLKNQEMLHNLFSSSTSSLARIAFNIPAIFFVEFLILGMTYTLSWLETLRDGNPFYFLVLNYHISVSIHSDRQKF